MASIWGAGLAWGWQAGQLAFGGNASRWQQPQHRAGATCARGSHGQMGLARGLHVNHWAQAPGLGHLPCSIWSISARDVHCRGGAEHLPGEVHANHGCYADHKPQGRPAKYANTQYSGCCGTC
eukprot:9477386-Karenia_brevis.AAC.1